MTVDISVDTCCVGISDDTSVGISVGINVGINIGFSVSNTVGNVDSVNVGINVDKNVDGSFTKHSSNNNELDGDNHVLTKAT